MVGFITAITDGVSCPHIPYLEVLPQWQGQGIDAELMRPMTEKLKATYAIDLICGEDVRRFYERFEFNAGRAMTFRRNPIEAR